MQEQSLSLYIQQSTRCLRRNGDKKAIIIDFVGNCYRHGLPTEKREWSLDQPIKCKNPSGENAILIRQCPRCYKVYQPKTRICPYCGYEAPKTEREIKQEEKAELERITKIEKKKKRQEVGMAKDFESLLKLAKERGYKNPTGWAYCILKARKKKR